MRVVLQAWARCLRDLPIKRSPKQATLASSRISQRSSSPELRAVRTDSCHLQHNRHPTSILELRKCPLLPQAPHLKQLRRLEGLHWRPSPPNSLNLVWSSLNGPYPSQRRLRRVAPCRHLAIGILPHLLSSHKHSSRPRNTLPRRPESHLKIQTRTAMQLPVLAHLGPPQYHTSFPFNPVLRVRWLGAHLPRNSTLWGAKRAVRAEPSLFRWQCNGGRPCGMSTALPHCRRGSFSNRLQQVCLSSWPSQRCRLVGQATSTRSSRLRSCPPSTEILRNLNSSSSR